MTTSTDQAAPPSGGAQPTNWTGMKWAALGAGAFLLLHAGLRLTWQSLFAVAPWPGSGRGAGRGDVPVFFTTTPRSYQLALASLFVLALLTVRERAVPRLQAGCALWAGVMLTSVGIWVATDRLRQDSNLWPIDFVFIAVTTAAPVLAGTAVAAAVAYGIGVARRGRASARPARPGPAES